MTARTPEQTPGRRMPLSGTPAALTAQAVQSWRMRKPGPPSHSLTASASRPSRLTCGPGDAMPQGDQNRHPVATTGTEGDHAFHAPADENADSRDADHHQEQVQRQDKAGRATRDADLPPSARDLPDARDVLPNIQLAELDARKLSDYSLKPGHPGNNGKANGWRALGYDVDNPEGRRDAARELRGLICDELLARGKVAETRDTAYGPSHRVLSGLTGPNGRHATLVTCWLIEERAGLSVPRLTTAWVQPHRDKETER